MQDQDVEVAYQDYKEQKESATHKISKAVSPKQLAIIGGAAIILIWATWVKNPPLINLKEAFIAAGVLALIGYIIMNTKIGEEDYIGIEIAQSIAIKDAQRQQKMNIIDEGTVDLLPIYTLQRIEGHPTMWFLGLKVKTNDRKIKKFVAKVDPWTGKPNGFIEKDEGIDLKEYMDIKFIRTKKDLFEDVYGNK